MDEKNAKWWFEGDEAVQHRLMDLLWVDKAIPELRKYAGRYSEDVAFVLGSGPSLLNIPDQELAALTRYFTVGVNAVAWVLQEKKDIYDLPAVNFITDRRKSLCAIFDGYNRGFRDCRGKTLVSYKGWGFHNDWQCPTFCGNPTWDMRFGIFITPSREIKFNRAVIGGIHLCALLGFKSICLLGVDHGGDYISQEETALADKGFAAMQVFLDQKNIRLWQVGTKSAITSVRPAKLRKVLKNAPKNLQAVTG